MHRQNLGPEAQPCVRACVFGGARADVCVVAKLPIVVIFFFFSPGRLSVRTRVTLG